MMNYRNLLSLVAAWLIGSAISLAQSAVAPNTPVDPSVPDDKTPVQLSPFVVSSEGDDGYRAANTLSGTRMNASLFQTPAAVSVLTKEFLDDIGAENTLDMIYVSMSSDHERTDAAGGLQQQYDVRVIIRGFTESALTRDYMPNMVGGRGILASDRFNVDRADLSRGPNSILYGASRPGGAINTSSKRAVLNGAQKSVALTVGSWAKKRSEVDVAFPLLKDQLALRVNTVLEDRKGWFEYEFLKQKGLALATTYQPFKTTQVRAGLERMMRDQLVGLNYPQADFGYSRWVMAGSPLAGNPLPGTNPAPTLLRSANALTILFAPQLRDQPFRLSTTGADMRPDLPGNQAPGYWETNNGGAAPAGNTVDDPYFGQVIPANAFLSGPGRTANHDYTVSSLFIDQRIGDLSLELGYTRTNYDRVNTQGNVNAVGDPNPVIPGAYYADGDSAVTGGRKPGTPLPDIGRANPFVGLPYVDSSGSPVAPSGEWNETMRASLGYGVDLGKHRRWLGRHSFAGFWQKQRTLQWGGSYQEYNLTPNNSQPIDSPTNRIVRRTYLDFADPAGAHGALDPRKYPIPNSPGMTAGWVSNGPSPSSNQKNTSWMLAMQSSFLADRLVFTAGYRSDRVEVNTASQGGVRLPNSTNLWTTRPYQFVDATAMAFTGPTTTFGAVLTPLPWLGFSYNQSQSVYPQGQTDILGRPREPIDGKGKDYGVRFNLFGGRLSANVNFYQNLSFHQWSQPLNTPRTQVVPAMNAILNTMVVRGQALPASLTALGLTQLEQTNSRETTDNDGQGTEIEVTGRIYKGWSISLNYSRNKLVQTNIAPDANGFLASGKALWDGNQTRLEDTPATVATFVRTRDNTPGRDFVLNPATFDDAYDYAVSVMDLVNVAEGKAPFAQIESSFNVFTSYRFDEGAWSIFKRSRVGVGANYRGPAVIGFDGANGAPFRGQSATIANLMAGKRFPLRRGQAIDVQFNFNNVFKQEDLLPYSAVSPGNVVRRILPRVRQNWTMRATYSF